MAVTTRSRAAASSPGAVHQSPLEATPAELCNTILALALMQAGGVDVKKGSWLGVLVSCKQLREEGTPVYLADNTFVATIQGRHGADVPHLTWPKDDHPPVHITAIDRSPVIDWLRVLVRVRGEWRRLIPSLAFRHSGNIIDFKLRSTEGGMARGKYILNFAFWDALLRALRSAGLTPRHVRWQPVPGAETNAGQLALVNRFVFTPLLSHYGVLEEERSPGRVLSEEERGAEGRPQAAGR